MLGVPYRNTTLLVISSDDTSNESKAVCAVPAPRDADGISSHEMRAGLLVGDIVHAHTALVGWHVSVAGRARRGER